jgi:hypothetical protein
MMLSSAVRFFCLRSRLQAEGQGACSDALAKNHFPKFVPMTLPLVLRTMAHDRDAASPGKPLDESERELLAVILYRPAARIDWAVHEQFVPVLAKELGPGNPTRLAVSKKPLTRRQRWHPHVVSGCRHSTSTESRR